MSANNSVVFEGRLNPITFVLAILHYLEQRERTHYLLFVSTKFPEIIGLTPIGRRNWLRKHPDKTLTVLFLLYDYMQSIASKRTYFGPSPSVPNVYGYWKVPSSVSIPSGENKESARSLITKPAYA